MAWNTAPSDPAVLEKMRECGLTVAGFVAPQDLDLCQAAGLKAIVSDPRISGYDWKNVNEVTARKNALDLVTQVGKHPALYVFTCATSRARIRLMAWPKSPRSSAKARLENGHTSTYFQPTPVLSS